MLGRFYEPQVEAATSVSPNPQPGEAPPSWHYERGGQRVGPVSENELHRLLSLGEITRDTLVWSSSVGASFVRLGDTVLAPPMTQPPALPASRVDDTLAWGLAALPLGAALLQRATESTSTSLWGWPLGTFTVCTLMCLVDEKRVARSGNAAPSARLATWVWLVPVYLFQRARALRGPKHYVWAWVASLVASLLVGGEIAAFLKGDTYLGAGVPTCDSAFEQKQVRKLFDGMDAVRAAGLTSTGLQNPRELGSAGDLRTCAAQVIASNATAYRVVYTVELQGDQILTNIQLQN